MLSIQVNTIQNPKDIEKCESELKLLFRPYEEELVYSTKLKIAAE